MAVAIIPACCIIFLVSCAASQHPPRPTVLFSADKVVLENVKFEFTMPPKETNLPAVFADLLKFGLASDALKNIYKKV